MQRRRDVPALLAAQGCPPAPQQCHLLAVLHHTLLAERFDHGVDVVAWVLADTGDDQGPRRDLAQFLAVQYRTAAQLPFEQWQGRGIGRLVALFRTGCGRDLIRPQHAAMAIGRCRGLLMPHRKIAFRFQAFCRLCFCLPGFGRPGLQQGNLLLGGDRIPVDAPLCREVARRLLRFDRPLAEQHAHRMRDSGKPRRTGAPVEHGLDAEPAGPGRDVGMIDRTQLLDPPGEPVEIDGADAIAVGQDAVEHRYMGVELRVCRLQRHLADVRIGPALPVPPLDIDRRPRGVVLKADPAQSAGLDGIEPCSSIAGKAEMCLGVGHRVGDRTSVNIQERGPFRLGRRQGPGDRQRLVGRKRHVDKTDRRAGGVDLPAVFRPINEPAGCQEAVIEVCHFLGRGLAMCRHAECRLEPLARPLDDRRRQCRAGGCLRRSAICPPSGQHIPDRVRRDGLFRIETEHFGDAAGRGVLFAPGYCATVKPCRIQQIRNAGLGQRPVGIGDAEACGQGRREVGPQLGDRAACGQVTLPDGAMPERRGESFLCRGTDVILGGPHRFGLQCPGEVVFRHRSAG